MKISNLLERMYIILVFLWSFLNVITYGTTLIQYEYIFNTINNFLYILWTLFRVFVCIKVIIQFEKKDFIILFLIFLTILMSLFNEGGWIAEGIWIICGTKKTNIRKIIQYIFIAHLTGFTVIISFNLIGIIQDYTIMRGNTLRHSLGFNHPNALGARIFQLLLMYSYLLKGKKLLAQLTIITIAVFITYKLTGSITVLSLMILFALMTCLFTMLNKNRHLTKKIINFLISKTKWLFLLFPVIATYAIIYFDFFESYFKGNLLARILQTKYYFVHYGISLFGKQLEINNSIDNYELQISNLYTLDNGYMYLLLGYGISSFLIFVIGNFLLSRKLLLIKNYYALLIIVLYALYGFTETMMIRFTYNFSIIFFAYLLWKTKDYRR